MIVCQYFPVLCFSLIQLYQKAPAFLEILLACPSIPTQILHPSYNVSSLMKYNHVTYHTYSLPRCTDLQGFGFQMKQGYPYLFSLRNLGSKLQEMSYFPTHINQSMNLQIFDLASDGSVLHIKVCSCFLQWKRYVTILSKGDIIIKKVSSFYDVEKGPICSTQHK